MLKDDEGTEAQREGVIDPKAPKLPGARARTKYKLSGPTVGAFNSWAHIASVSK